MVGAVASGAEGDRLRQELGQLLAGHPDGVQPALQLPDALPVSPEQELLQLGQIIGARLVGAADAPALPGQGISSAGRSFPASHPDGSRDR